MADRNDGEHGYSGMDVGQQLGWGVAGVSVEEWARGIDGSDFGFDRNSNSNSDGGYGSDHDLNSEFDGDSGSGYNSESDGDSRSDYNSESDGDSGSGYNFESDNNSGFNPNAESDGDSSFNSDSKSDSDSEFDYNSKVQLHRELADDYGRLANDFFDYVAGTPTTMVGLPTTPSTTDTDDYFVTMLADDFSEYVATLVDYYGRLADDYSDHITTLADDYFYYSSRLQG
uniref:Uncharacterized protein n=1 Tax=Setaria viridis TaxID=4556 RepID=A0A4U6TAZ2_SETVI|nr:hypothetical protein SEVIR_9G279700v2 [Setaria viridis]